MIECSRVHDERPSSSTSGGHSFGGAEGFVMVFLCEVKSASELQVRHLATISTAGTNLRVCRAHGFPSFPNTMPFFLGGLASPADVEVAVAVAVLPALLSRFSTVIIIFTR